MSLYVVICRLYFSLSPIKLLFYNVPCVIVHDENRFHTQAPHIGSTHWFHTQAPHIGSTHWFHTQVPHTGSTHWFHTQVPHTGSTHRFHTQVPYTGSTHWFHIQVPHTPTGRMLMDSWQKIFCEDVEFEIIICILTAVAVHT